MPCRASQTPHVHRVATLLVAAAVTALGLAAGVDALRQGGSLTADLRSTGVAGVLVMSDERCRLRALVLPELESAAAPDARACRFSLSKEGFLTVGGAVRQPGGPFTAWCRSGAVELAARSGTSLPFTRLYRFRGCAPAWRPDGTLTYVRDREVVQLDMSCRGGGGFCTRRLLSRPELGGLGAVEILWLDRRTLALLAPGRVALYRDGSPVGHADLGPHRLTGLEASPRGTFLAVRSGGPETIVVLDRALRRVPLPADGGRAIAWSPDERWVALATVDAIVLSPVREPGERTIRLPLRARDLAWRTQLEETYALRPS